MWVHGGYFKAYTSARAKLCDLVVAAMQGKEEEWTVAATGHSLGAALGTLCAYDVGKFR